MDKNVAGAGGGKRSSKAGAGKRRMTNDFAIDVGNIGKVGLMAHHRERPLTVFEKKFLLCAERGDVVSVRKFLDTHRGIDESKFNINCVDPLGRTALVLAIENENMDLIQILLRSGAVPGDSLLHAISEEYVEAVETLLLHEETIHKPGAPYSWELIDPNMSIFTRDITPLILAAHKNNYEILKMLLDRGAAIPLPHDARCGCDDCVKATKDDNLRHSRSRINAYRALCSPSLIALSSRDPILTAFQLSWELRRLHALEKEFATEYKQLREQVQTFAVNLLDHVRTNQELKIILNYDPKTGNQEEYHEKLERVKLAIEFRQKKFIAHPNVQQLLGSVWFQGMPGDFRRRSPIGQAFEVASIAIWFPILSLFLLMIPNSSLGKKASKPFVRFITYSASYLFFLTLLAAESQRFETLIVESINPEYVPNWLLELHQNKRGKLPTLTESLIILYVIGFVWQETAELFGDGIVRYVSDLWNVVDFLTNCLYVNWILLRILSFIQVKIEEANQDGDMYDMNKSVFQLNSVHKPREEWDPYDPMFIAEGMFGAANIFSFLKLVHIFSVHPHLGPLQISLGRMVFDIIKFFFIYTWVVFAFGCGMNQLLWYYSQKDYEICFASDPNSLSSSKEYLSKTITELDKEHSCSIWRRFSNLFETSQTLFWASFGLIDLLNFELSGIKEFTRFWGMLMFGSYSIINVVVLLNLLIAMMSDSYQVISSGRDTEWKFARSKLWITYFDDTNGVPPPFNLIPSTKMISKSCKKVLCCSNCSACCETGKSFNDSFSNATNQAIYERVMKSLVRRYVTREQRRIEETGLVTEDDVNEIKQDIASFRFELIDLLKRNGFKSEEKYKESSAISRKERSRERRLLRGFSIGLVDKAGQSAGGAMAGMGHSMEGDGPSSDEENVPDKVSRFRRASYKRKVEAAKRWTAAITAVVQQGGNQIGSISETPELRQSLADIREKILQEQEFSSAAESGPEVEERKKRGNKNWTGNEGIARFVENRLDRESDEKMKLQTEESEVQTKSHPIEPQVLSSVLNQLKQGELKSSLEQSEDEKRDKSVVQKDMKSKEKKGSIGEEELKGRMLEQRLLRVEELRGEKEKTQVEEQFGLQRKDQEEKRGLKCEDKEEAETLKIEDVELNEEEVKGFEEVKEIAGRDGENDDEDKISFSGSSSSSVKRKEMSLQKIVDTSSKGGKSVADERQTESREMSCLVADVEERRRGSGEMIQELEMSLSKDAPVSTPELTSSGILIQIDPAPDGEEKLKRDEQVKSSSSSSEDEEVGNEEEERTLQPPQATSSSRGSTSSIEKRGRTLGSWF